MGELYVPQRACMVSGWDCAFVSRHSHHLVDRAGPGSDLGIGMGDSCALCRRRDLCVGVLDLATALAETAADGNSFARASVQVVHWNTRENGALTKNREWHRSS